MISFRYHLVSIVATLLALGIGIVLGSGFLGGSLLNRLEGDVRQVTERNQELLDQLEERERELRSSRVFAEEARQTLLDGALAGQQVVLFAVAGTDEAVLDGLRQAVEEGGGEIASTILLNERLALRTPDDRAELAFILESGARGENQLRREVGVLLGSAASAVASSQPVRRPGSSAEETLDDLVRGLEEAGFVQTEPREGVPVVPPLAHFLVAAGSVDDPPFPPAALCRSLGLGLAEREGAVVIAEPSDSLWGVVAAARAEERSVERIATEDQAETPHGQIAAILALRNAAAGDIGHFGVGPGATEILPQPPTLAG